MMAKYIAEPRSESKMQHLAQEHYIVRIELESPDVQVEGRFIYQREFVEYPTDGDIKDAIDEELAGLDPGWGTSYCRVNNLAKCREMMDFKANTDNNGFLSICGTKIGRIDISKTTVLLIDNRRATCTS
jgi:hypothetical protein